MALHSQLIPTNPEWAQYRNVFPQAGTKWDSQWAMGDLNRLLAAQQFPFMMNMGNKWQQGIYGMMGPGLGQQDAFRNAGMQNALAMQNQAHAQGLVFNPADFNAQAMMDANRMTMGQVASQPQRWMQAIGMAGQPWQQYSQSGNQYNPYPAKGPSFLQSLAGTAGSLYGMGAFGGAGGGMPSFQLPATNQPQNMPPNPYVQGWTNVAQSWRPW